MDEDEQARLAARDSVIAQIERAFDGVSREGGVSLHEADRIDAGASGTEQVKARRLDTESRWQDVPGTGIDACYHVLSFFDVIGFRYYIAAFMVWSLKCFRDSASNVSDFTIYALLWRDEKDRNTVERYESLNGEQVKATCMFLRFMVNYGEGYADTYSAQQALDWYWGRFCTAD